MYYKPYLFIKCFIAALSCSFASSAIDGQPGHSYRIQCYRDIELPGYTLTGPLTGSITEKDHVEALYDHDRLVRLTTFYGKHRITDTVVYSGNEAFYVQQYKAKAASKDSSTYIIKRVVNNVLVTYWVMPYEGHYILSAIDSMTTWPELKECT